MRDEEPAGLGINGVIPGDGDCVVERCSAPAREDALMCYSHWLAVPESKRRDLVRAMARWRKGKGHLGDLREAQWACVEALD